MTNYGCNGPSSQADYGNRVCKYGVFSGAEWLRPQTNSTTKRESPKQPCNQTAITHLTIEGRSFRIFGDVPEEVSHEMIAYFKNHSYYDGNLAGTVPDLFLPFEDLARSSTENGQA
ncbi:hypothetical protein PRZ48_010112 [Zasmidium cellare]|uniref:Uncharacterized protein n=1 Tax=Zasmidium cellare TaxID=395010 RepID=A0ABR0EDM0_ZASCE|nr:hypothetical protein PRZ48_010112 [Zasmidium cellare]